MCFQLVRLEFPGAERLAPPDGGLDFLLREGGTVVRGWQAKRFTAQIAWPACRKSLDRALSTYAPDRVTFCFARDLTASQDRLFAKHLRANPGVHVDYWGRSELTARLTGTDEGQRVARHFFGTPASDARDIALALRAGGSLQTSTDAVDRQQAIGEFLKAHDPYFSYQSSQREASFPSPERLPGVAVSFERIAGDLVQRIDAMPRSPDAVEKYGPTGHFTFEGPNADAALQRFKAFLAHGGHIELDDGVSFTFDKLPPALAEFGSLGRPLKGRVRVTGPSPQPLSCRVIAESTLGKAELEMDMESVPPPGDWEHAREGQQGGLTATLLIRRRGDGGQAALNWRYRMDESPMTEQQTALSLLKAVHGDGAVQLVDPDSNEPLLPPFKVAAKPLDEFLDEMIRLVDDLATIELWAGVTLEVPPEISGEEAEAIAYTAYWIRKKRLPVKWRNLSFILPPENLATVASGQEITVREEAYLRLFGQEIHLGTREFTVSDTRIVDTQALSDGAESRLKVTVVPTSDAAGRVDMILTPPAAPA